MPKAKKPTVDNEPSGPLVVGIGASAGGIQALSEFFSNAPKDAGIVYVVILHLSPDHDSHLAHVLQQVTELPVTQVTKETKIRPDHVYVVPPDKSLTLADHKIIVKPIKTVEERRAPVDIFFRTLADTHGPNAVGVILSGTGANGSMGLKRIKEFGGATFAQNPREAEFNEMPRNSIATDLVDMILPVAEIPQHIVKYRDRVGRIHIPEEPADRPYDQQSTLRDIFTQLRVRTGHDFSNYKRPTMLRRIERRISVKNLDDLSEYASYLRENPDEANALLKDLLISVTNFFRDKKAFDALEKRVLRKLFSSAHPTKPIRIWVAGCATGEEAYSIAMIASELTASGIDGPPVQIFATDIDEQAIAIAREGVYTLNDAAHVSPERLRRFFTKEGDNYRVRREIRETILFAHHNLIKDPPFSHLDLVTCRNLLIYLNHAAQERVMETIHFALRPGGYFFVGSSESVDGSSDLYTPVDKEHHIFQSRQVATRPFPVPESVPIYRATIPAKQENGRKPTDSLERMTYNDLHLRLVEEFAPPSVVINQDYDIVHVSESAGKYMIVAGGEPTNNLLRLIRPDLRLELRTALFQATQQHTNVEVRGINVRINSHEEKVNLLVRPVTAESDTARGFILVAFEQADGAEQAPRTGDYVPPEPVAQQLEEELVRSRTQLQSALEQSEVQAEELRASNEELQAMNEELRSSAEELETSKEELQSINEELTTVNQELKVKIDELSHTNNNFTNLLSSIDIGVIFLDRSLRVNLFSPAASRIFNLISSDVGRPLSDITSRLNYGNLAKDADQVLEKLQTVEREVDTADGQTFVMRVFPYRTIEDRINGVVLTFVDITERTTAQRLVHQSEQRLQQMVNIPLVGVLTFDYDGNFVEANDAFLKIIGYTRREFVDGHFTWRTFTPPEYIEQSESMMQSLLTTGTGGPYEKEYIRKDGSRVWLMFIASNIGDGRIVEFAIDVSARKEAERRAAVFEQGNRNIVNSIEDYAIFAMDNNRTVTSWSRGAESTFGWTPDEIVGKSGDLIFTPEDKKARIPEKEAATAVLEGRAPDERYHMRKDGSRFYASGVMTPLRDDSAALQGFVKIARDMTSKMAAEKALNDREMLQKLVAGQEEERARLARDLHDELGQQLTVMRLKLQTLKANYLASELYSELEEIEEIAGNIDVGVDHITWELRPLALEDLGLVTALEKYIKDWCRHSSVDCELIGSSLKKTRFKPEVETNLYRIVQEALNNVAKHARAKHVEVMFERRDDMLVLVIEDDGKGFNTKNRKLMNKGLGLTGMRERAALIGGSLEIESAPKNGTTIFAKVPAAWALLSK
ncbi:MAG: PAS domain S-box protein [Acidobacteria bacterium]|nr:PAS domain S-box protein [Acidobacteriota bacterium]